MIQAMLAGTLDITTGQPTTVQQYDLVALASLSARRIPGFESVPTVKEATGTEVIASIWTGIFAPPKTPAAVIGVLDRACKAALADKETLEHFAKQNQPITYLGAADFTRFVAEDYERTRAVMAAAGLKTN